MNTNEHGLDRLTENIIGCSYSVSNTLGTGFLERVYENSLAHELRQAGSVVEQQKGIAVRYDGIIVGEYVADLVVDQAVIVEVKTARFWIAATWLSA